MDKTITTESEFQVSLSELERKTSEALRALDESSKNFQEAHGKWEKIKDSLRSQGCKT
jgi:hypothetical protein